MLQDHILFFMQVKLGRVLAMQWQMLKSRRLEKTPGAAEQGICTAKRLHRTSESANPSHDPSWREKWSGLTGLRAAGLLDSRLLGRTRSCTILDSSSRSVLSTLFSVPTSSSDRRGGLESCVSSPLVKKGLARSASQRDFISREY